MAPPDCDGEQLWQRRISVMVDIGHPHSPQDTVCWGFFKKQTGREGGMKSEGHGKFLFLGDALRGRAKPGRAVVGVASKDPPREKGKRPLHLDARRSSHRRVLRVSHLAPEEPGTAPPADDSGSPCRALCNEIELDADSPVPPKLKRPMEAELIQHLAAQRKRSHFNCHFLVAGGRPCPRWNCIAH